MNKNRAEKNFQYWKTLVNLPRYFPSLPPLKPDELSDLIVMGQEDEHLIMNSIFSKPLTQVVVPDGNGLTTLFQYIFKKCEDKSFDRLILPVSIDFEKPGDIQGFTHEFLEHTIKKQVMKNLVRNPWDSILPEEIYYYCINYEQDRDYHAYRAEMLDFLSDGKRGKGWAQLLKIFPFLKKSLDEFLNYLLTQLRIQTVIFFHIPRHDIDEQKILDLVSAWKIIYEQNKFEPASVRETYFINRSIQADLNREYKRDYFTIHVPGKISGEIFAMMNNRFRPSLPGDQGRKDRIDLGSVFAEDFIKLSWSETRGIQEIIEATEQMLLEKLDCDRKDIAYRLAPDEKQFEKAKESALEAQISQQIKFVRKKRK